MLAPPDGQCLGIRGKFPGALEPGDGQWSRERRPIIGHAVWLRRKIRCGTGRGFFCIDRSRLSAEVSTACPQPLWRSGIWGGEGNISIDSRRGFPLSWRLPAEFPARWPPPPRPTAWTVASGPNTLLRACEEALDAGATPEEILHALILLTSTIGFPTVVAGLTWVGDILEGKRG